MVKNIILHLDEELFYKFKKDKIRQEMDLCDGLTWEEYFKLMFGFKR